MPPPSNQVFDVIIAGGGVAGLALACSLRDALGAGVKVLIADPRLGESEGRDRAYAVAGGPRRLLERVGAWAAIAPTWRRGKRLDHEASPSQL